jgi:hypothetical protein
MSKEDAIQMDGEVVETLPNTTFRVKLKNARNRSSHTFYVLADAITATHVERPELYRRPSKAEATRQQEGQISGREAFRAAQPRARKWTKLELPAPFCGGRAGRGPRQRAVVYLTRCADLDKNGKLLGDVRVTRDLLGRWHFVVQRRPRAVRPLRPAEQLKSVGIDPGVKAAFTCFSPERAKVVTYCTGAGGVEHLVEKHLLKADECITQLRKLKGEAQYGDAEAKKRYQKAARRLQRCKLRHFHKVTSRVNEMQWVC